MSRSYGLAPKVRRPPGMRSLVFLAVGGCAQHVYAPPLRGFDLAGPHTIGAGVTAVSLALGGAGHSLGPSLGVGEVSVRHGVSAAVDLSADLTAYHITDDS